jgi:hypothetical protein
MSVAQRTTRTELPVILKGYDLVLWSCRHLAKFPRSFRFTLGDGMERRLYEILDGLLQAKCGHEKVALLQAVNLKLELLRFQYRLAHELRCLSTDSYGYASRTVNEIGQMVGGWLRSLQQRRAGA